MFVFESRMLLSWFERARVRRLALPTLTPVNVTHPLYELAFELLGIDAELVNLAFAWLEKEYA
jgi:hypothetical protein